MTLTIEKYSALLRIVLPNQDKVFWKKAKGVGFIKKMTQIMGIHAKIIDYVKKQKGNSECFTWEFIKKYLFESKDDE